jgi:AcrR family transcriptional regulator
MAKQAKGRARKAPRSAKGELHHGDVMTAAARVDPALRERSALLWEERPPSTRGPKPGLTREDVTEAAMAIAGEEGIGAVTMHAVAKRLGYTTMALYRYVPSKEALYDAIVDAGLGLPPAPREGISWRQEITTWSFAKRDVLIARPWLAELPFVAAPHGPHWLLWLEALARPLSRTGLSPADQGQMISIIDGYTRGASDTVVSLAQARTRGMSQEEWAAAVGADLGRAVGDPRFPAFAAIITAPQGEKPLTMTESFGFGLDRILDGIEMYVSGRES